LFFVQAVDLFCKSNELFTVGTVAPNMAHYFAMQYVLSDEPLTRAQYHTFWVHHAEGWLSFETFNRFEHMRLAVHI
jgi:hypothetical protein